MTEPTYWDHSRDMIRGDLVDLRRHVTELMDDLGFCAEHTAIRAIDHWDDEALGAVRRLGSSGLRRLKTTRTALGLHPKTATLIGFSLAALSGVLLYQALASHRHRP